MYVSFVIDDAMAHPFLARNSDNFLNFYHLHTKFKKKILGFDHCMKMGIYLYAV